ncbi:glutamate--cysteine ligase [Marinilabiliaceae bacterium ANBcel2]|nr:glutamate--cysteine ligase [Marinilabiliaceae bacterium ANBcel2]
MDVLDILNEPIESKEQLINYFASGSKPADNWGIGTEHEKFLFDKEKLTRLTYEGSNGIKSILSFMKEQGWSAVTENNNLIALTKNGASITLEPGGQFELSGRNFKNVHQTWAETLKHFDELRTICSNFNAVSLCMGFDPLSRREDIDWMPKKRYQYMRQRMPKQGSLGLDMMSRTASIQVNLDYLDQEDMIKKMRVAQAFQPVVTALFANSPFVEGKPNGYLSYRSRVWDDTDSERCGFLSFIFDDDFGFEKWCDYLLDIPLYFVYRDNQFLPANNKSFRQFIDGELPWRADMTDWEIHLSTVFPDIRLKKFIEIRGADAGCAINIASLSALWVGILYNEEILNRAYDMAMQWSVDDISTVRELVAKDGLSARANSYFVKEVATDLLNLSFEGLAKRSKILGIENESCYLDPLFQVLNSGITPAERHLDEYYNKWQGDLKKMVKEWPYYHPLERP